MTIQGWHEEVDENESEISVNRIPTRGASLFAFATSTLASLLGLASMLWQHIASVAAATTAEDMAYGTLKSHIGLNAMALGWAGVVSFVLVSIGLLVMITALIILDRMTEN